ncbi:MAG: antitoxin [Candidatus Nanoarchaeia archaeon]|nr:antitoxin [Candidatus Nanoarchaeia archaeon]
MIDNIELYKKIIEIRGKDSQCHQAMEECAELTVALSHYVRKRPNSIEEIIEELGDVEIMIQQLKVMFGKIFEAKVEENKIKKINNLLKEVENTNG